MKKLERTKIGELKPSTTANIRGYVERIRDAKWMKFIIVRDLYGSVQVTIDKGNMPEMLQATEGLSIESFVDITGKVVENPAVKLGGIEIIPENFIIDSIAEAIPIDPESAIDQRLDYRWIDLRRPDRALIFKVQTAFMQAVRQYLLENNFMEIHSPKIISQPSESGSDLFEVDYFDKKAYLAQSPQFYKQMAIASGFERIFEVGPVFRAEKSYTNRHTTEFTGVDLEIANIDSPEDVMNIEEELLVYALSFVKEKYGKEIKETLGVDVIVPSRPFPRISMPEVVKAMKQEGFDMEEGDDLTTETEKGLGKYMTAKYGHEFYFVTEYPSDTRAFYHMRYTDKPNVAKGYDLYWKGIEITTGAQREHRYEQLTKQALATGLSQDKIQFYLNFFRYGCPRHGGFGIGLDRITMLLLDLPNLKESMFIFRGPSRLTP